MPVRQSAVDRGKARGHRFVVELSRELEDARIASGLSYAWLGKAVGISGQQAARVCRGESPGASIVGIAGLLAAARLDLSVRAYPAGPPVRDAAHLALLARFRARIATSLIWRAEVPVLEGPQGLVVGSGPPDRRAWDAVIEGRSWRVGVEAETRLGDVQALERRIALKQRDGSIPVVVLLVNDTAHNRRIIGLEAVGLRSMFPGTPRRTLRTLGEGNAPAVSTLVLL
ncbi:MAG: hypothetical protein E6I65_11745 [Chloroflexi bacterium]|nr:MAG: hypothetical protein E6I65_11745 [Chloroflexota bacterium]